MSSTVQTRAEVGSGRSFLDQGGELGQLIRDFDWSNSTIGEPDSWPRSLQTAVRIMLTSRQPIWIGWGPDLTYLYNDAYKSIIGGKHPWALGRPTREVWQEIWNDIGPLLDTALGEGQGTYVEEQLLIMERNGYPEETYYTFSYTSIPGDDGHVAGIICVNSDDTQRVIAERQLALLRDLAAHALTTADAEDVCLESAAAMSVDQHDIPFALIYLRCEETGAATLVGASGIDAGALLAPSIIHQDEASIWPITEALDSGNTIIVDLGAVPPDERPSGPWPVPSTHAALLPLMPTGSSGRAGVIVVGLNPFRKHDDAYANFLSLVAGQVSASISRAEALKEEKRRADALAELDRAKTLFFSNVSHELRTPLTLMLGPMEEILSKPAGPQFAEQHALVDVAHRNGIRLLKMVNSLLDFARVEAGREQASFSETDLAELTAGLASSFRSATERAGLALVVECPPLPKAVFVDRDMWEKVVLNLLSNAFKFTLDGEIKVSMYADNGEAILTVRDSGIGIPENELPHIFERFHRVERAGGRSHEGTGIGLALVKELVRLNGGTIDVASAIGIGTTFTVRLPLGSDHVPADKLREQAAPHFAKAPAKNALLTEAMSWLPDGAVSTTAAVSVSEPPPGDVSSTRRLVLLVDDNADMRSYLQRLLSDRYAVEAVADGEAALEAVRCRRPDLILTDVMMPRLDGFGLLRALRADPHFREIPVILLSARAGEEAQVEGIDAGADDYLVKPFNARELMARVQANLNLSLIRGEAAEVLRQSEAQFRTLAQAMPNHVWTSGPDGQLSWFNEQVYAYSNVKAGELDGDRWATIVHPDDLAAAAEKWAHALATGDPYETQFRVRRADGVYRWHIVRAAALRGSDGAIRQWIGTNTDIDDQKAAETSLASMNETLEKMVAERTQERDRAWNNSRDLLNVMDKNGVFIAANPAWKALLGWEPEEVIGQHYLAFGHPDEASKNDRAVDDAARDRLDYFESRVLHKDGSYRWIGWLATPVGDQIYSAGRDVTREKAQDEAIERSEARLRSVFETTYQAQALITPDGVLIDANPTALEGFEARLEDVVGTHLWESPWFAATPGMPERIKEAVAWVAKGQPFREEITVKLPAGQRTFDFAMRPVRNNAGEIIAIVPEAMDLTDRRVAEEQLRHAQKMEAIGQLTGGIAHDFNNLMAGVISALALTRRRIAAGKLDDVGKFMEAADASARRAATLTQRLLAFARRQSLAPSICDVPALISGMTDLLHHTIGENVSLEVARSDGVWPAMTDAHQFENALLNLVINARDAMPEGGRLRIGVANKTIGPADVVLSSDVNAGDYLEIAVADSGTGMPPEVIQKAFDPFFTTKPIGQGTGLGLSMVYGFAKQSGGFASIDSTPGHGTIVRLYLPRAIAARQAVEAVDVQELPTGRGETILVVEDDPTVRLLAVATLNDLGYRCLDASDASTGIPIIQSPSRIDLLLTDVGLPKINGRQLAEIARQHRPGLKVLFMTGYAEKAALRGRFLDEGMGLITKPFDLEDFSQKVREMIEARPVV